jgi:hypothetical protein
MAFFLKLHLFEIRKFKLWKDTKDNWSPSPHSFFFFWWDQGLNSGLLLAKQALHCLNLHLSYSWDYRCEPLHPAHHSNYWRVLFFLLGVFKNGNTSDWQCSLVLEFLSSMGKILVQSSTLPKKKVILKSWQTYNKINILTWAGKSEIARMQDSFCSPVCLKLLDYNWHIVGTQIIFVELSYTVSVIL